MPYIEVSVVREDYRFVGLVKTIIGVTEIACKKLWHPFDFEEDDSVTLFGKFDSDSIADVSFELRCTRCGSNCGYIETDFRNFQIDEAKYPFSGADLAGPHSIADFVVPGYCDYDCLASSEPESDQEP